MRFVLGIESIEGTVMEKRIDEVLNWEPSKNQGYKPRKTGKNKNLQHYTPEMIDYVA